MLMHEFKVTSDESNVKFIHAYSSFHFFVVKACVADVLLWKQEHFHPIWVRNNKSISHRRRHWGRESCFVIT